MDKLGLGLRPRHRRKSPDEVDSSLQNIKQEKPMQIVPHVLSCFKTSHCLSYDGVNCFAAVLPQLM